MNKVWKKNGFRISILNNILIIRKESCKTIIFFNSNKKRELKKIESLLNQNDLIDRNLRIYIESDRIYINDFMFMCTYVETRYFI